MAITDPSHIDDSDVSLIRRTRAGDHEAYGSLHARHHAAALAVARRMSRSGTDADDLVSEGFARVLAALQRGTGPDVAFRPYLLSTIRRLAYDRTSREQREAPVEYDLEGAPSGAGDPVVEGFERDTAAAAFASLPERWRMVLWHTEVEGQNPAEVADLLGMKPNAVAALAYRAREGLRQAYLSHHATAGAAAPLECRAVNDRLAAYIRDGLSPTQHARVRDHLDDCEDCAAAYLELASVNTSLKGLVGFVVLGPLWAAYANDAAAGLLLPAAATAATATAAGGVAAGATGSASAGLGVTSAAATGAGASGGGASASVAAWWPPKSGPQAVAAVAAVVVAIAVAAAALVAFRGDDQGDAAVRSDSPPSLADAGSTADPGPIAPQDPTPSTPTPGPEPGLDDAPDASTPDPAEVTPTPPPTSTPDAPEAPASPGSPAPGPSSSAPAPAAPTPPASPTTPPPTTPPPTTPPPPPPAPSELSVEVASAGSIVSGRAGVVVVRALNDGAGPGVDVVLEVDLGDLALRGLPITADRGSGEGVTGRGVEAGADRGAPWVCESPSPSRLVCRSADVDPSSSQAFYVPVLAPVGPGATSVAVAISGAGDPGVALPATEIPIQASGMAARFAVVDHGGITFAGNTLVTCPDSHPSCAAARAGEGSLLDNGSFAMELIDVVPEMGALNSSSAAVDLPAGARVLSAQLYWGGNTDGGTGGSPAPDPGRRDTALLRHPDGVVSEVTAERVDVEGSVYQATAEVTDLVVAGGAGEWTVADVQLGSGFGAHGGWALAVVYHHEGDPLRSLVLLDGLSRVGAGSSVELELGGFVVPDGGAASATLDVVVHEGDAGLTGDQLSVGGVALVDEANPLGNTFNSTASDRGDHRDGGDPGHRNLFGLDLDRFDIAGALAPGSTSVTVEFSTSADVYLPGVVAFVVDQ